MLTFLLKNKNNKIRQKKRQIKTYFELFGFLLELRY